MGTTSIDNIAMPTANAERLMEFYKRMGFAINDEEAWRKGEVGIFSIQVGDSKINIHPEGLHRHIERKHRCTRLYRHLLCVGKVRLRNASRCWPRPASRSSGARALARAPEPAAACRRSACTPETRTTICWNG